MQESGSAQAPDSISDKAQRLRAIDTHAPVTVRAAVRCWIGAWIATRGAANVATR